MKPFAAAVLLVALPTSAMADWLDIEWEFQARLVKPSCVACGKTEQEAFDAEKAHIARVKAWGPTEMRAIAAWMEAMGYDAPILPAPAFVIADKVANAVQKDRFGDWKDTAGQYSPEDGIEVRFSDFYDTAVDKTIPYDENVLVKNKDTLAHELYHAVQEVSGNYDFDNTWHSEGIPSAVAGAWTLKSLDYWARVPGNYSEPLHKPENPYSRGEFFYFLGKALNPANPVAYIADLMKASAKDGAHGLNWLDDFLKPTKGGLADYYPYYIAEVAYAAKHFRETNWSGPDPKPTPKPLVSAGSIGQSDASDEKVREVAATYNDTSPEFTGDWSSLDDIDRIYANILSIEKAERVADLHLVVGSSVYAGNERFVAPMFAAPGVMKKPYNARVTNAAVNVPTTLPQNFTLRLETAQVTFGLPACLEAGKTAQITIEGPLTAAENALIFASGSSRLRASAGKIDDSLMFTAPSAAQKVTISLTLMDPMGKGHRVKLPAIDITSSGCMVRMTAGDNDITYVPDGDYSEANVRKEGVAVYLKENDIAMYRGGWQKIPAQGKAMMVGMMNKTMMVGVPSFFDDGHPEKGNMEPWKTHRMPKIIAERLAWRNLHNAKTPDGGAATRKTAPCPTGGGGCSTTTIVAEGNSVSIIFDDAQRAIAVTQGGTLVTFGYDGYDVRRPPGW